MRGTWWSLKRPRVDGGAGGGGNGGAVLLIRAAEVISAADEEKVAEIELVGNSHDQAPGQLRTNCVPRTFNVAFMQLLCHLRAAHGTRERRTTLAAPRMLPKRCVSNSLYIYHESLPLPVTQLDETPPGVLLSGPGYAAGASCLCGMIRCYERRPSPTYPSSARNAYQLLRPSTPCKPNPPNTVHPRAPSSV